MPLFGWFTEQGNKANVYAWVNLAVNSYQVFTYWFDVQGFGNTLAYVLIFFGFVLPPLVMSGFLLLGVNKRHLKKIWTWWLIEIALLTLYLTLFITGIFLITLKVIFNLILHSSLRIFGLKLIYDYMLILHESRVGSKIEPSGILRNEASFEVVPLDDPWSNNDKF